MTTAAEAPRRPARSHRAPRLTLHDLSLGELVCLALVDNGVNHGWAIGTELAPDGELGRIWTLSRPLTYRAIEQLATKNLLRRSGQPSGHGRERSVLSCTSEGRRIAGEWLDEPVEHLRQVRTELLLKLVLRRRQGAELRPLLEAQKRTFDEHFDALTAARPGADPVDLWRRESARAVRRFLDAALGHSRITPDQEPLPMRLSARNQLHARVTAIVHGDVISTVKTTLPGGQVVTAVITKESTHDLDLAPDDEVLVVIKSTEVMLAKP